MLTVFAKAEEKSRSKNELKETIDGVKEFGSCIGSVPLAELGTIVYVGFFSFFFLCLLHLLKQFLKRKIYQNVIWKYCQMNI